MSSFKEFGRVVEKTNNENFPEFGKVVEETPRWKSLLNAPVKGVLKEVGDISTLLQKVPLPKGPLRGEQINKFAEEKFPTQEKGPEKLLERGGRLIPGALLGPGGLAVKGAQVVGGALLGHGAEKLGLPSWAQAIAEGLPFFYSGGKKIPLKSSQKRLGEFLRKEGLNENEIAPLINSPEKLELLSKYASKGKKSRKLFDSIYTKTGHLYDSITNSGKNLPALDQNMKTQILNDFSSIIKDLPHEYRQLVKHDLMDLVTKGRGGAEDLINFYQDVNTIIGPRQGGRAVVGRFKEPIIKGLNSIKPELAEDFQLANELYKTRINVASHLLSKKDLDKVIDIGEAAALGAGIFNRDLGMIGKVIGLSGARKLARELLINPRLQNISTRIGEAIRKNKYTLAEKYLNEFSDMIGKDDPELSESIRSTMPKK